jgi:hypothetical protein
MLKHVKYLRYVLTHKWFVFVACLEYGLVWRGIKHDWHKFLPSEWFPYVNFFFGKNAQRRDKTGYYKTSDTDDAPFERAWKLHQKRSDHHWQWWTETQDDGRIVVKPMSWAARAEMLCDWRGAGRAQGKPNTWEWYDANRDKILITDEDRRWIEAEVEKEHHNALRRSAIQG